tara:strand:+ start:771 stop:1430 length:660 start_codon:yes stop_codon:yes gene_type:complete
MDLERYLATMLTDEESGVFGEGYGGPDPEQLFNDGMYPPGNIAPVPLGGQGYQNILDRKYAERLRGLMSRGASAAGALGSAAGTLGNTVLDTSLRDVGNAVADVTLRDVGKFGANALSWAGKGLGMGAKAALPLGAGAFTLGSEALSQARNALKNIKLQKTQVGVLPDGSRATYDDGTPITRTQDVSLRSPVKFQSPVVTSPPPRPATPISYDDEEWGF